MTDADAQEDELLALASIYDEDVFTSQTEAGEKPEGQFCATVNIPEPFEVSFGAKSSDSYAVKFLPPVMLSFQLPADYPSVSPPQYTLSSKWLTIQQLSNLCKRLDELWEENVGEVTLFLWLSFLQDESADFLELTSPLDLTDVIGMRTSTITVKGDTDSEVNTNQGAKDSSIASSNHGNDPRAIQDIASQDLLKPTILEFDKDKEAQVFQITQFTCQVCFCEKLGALCMTFSGCGHVYCKECMKGYFEVQINDGSVKALECPSDKCESQAYPGQVKELVSAELFSRYDRLLLQSSLDTMSDIIYCPRTSCCCPVVVDDGNNMGSCPSCHYVFCVFCKMVYHGVSPCRIQAKEIKKLRDAYVSANDAEKRQMEKRYGRQVIAHIVEDSFTQDWLDEYSKKCPHCGTYIQKIDGCNKMTCTKCRSFFCWLCQAVLRKGNPYSHFNDPVSACFNQLFQGVTPDWDEEEWEPVYIENN